MFLPEKGRCYVAFLFISGVPESPNCSGLAHASFVPMFIAGILLLLFGTVVWAQQTTADILGTVTDASGGVLTGVRITVHNLDTAADYTATTNSAGEYLVTLLPVGRYSVKAVAPGFKTWMVPEVTLAIGDRLRQDVRLQAGALEQSVEVTEALRLYRRTALH